MEPWYILTCVSQAEYREGVGEALKHDTSKFPYGAPVMVLHGEEGKQRMLDMVEQSNTKLDEFRIFEVKVTRKIK